jgi:hypothetical protein
MRHEKPLGDNGRFLSLFENGIMLAINTLNLLKLARQGLESYQLYYVGSFRSYQR